MKKTLVVIAALAALLLILCCGSAQAGNGWFSVVESGKCGPNLQYRVWSDGEYCEVEVGGTGPMYDYLANDSPFANRSDIKWVYALATTIGKHAFEGCVNLESLRVLGNETVSIGDYAFYGCTSLTSVEFTAITNHVGYMAFANTSISSFQNNAENPYLTVIDGALYNADCTTLIAYAHSCSDTEFTIPATVTRIEAGAFYNAQQTITFEDISTLREVGDYAFYNCPNLVAELPASLQLTEIGKYAFYNCSGLTGSVCYAGDIEDYAFYNCSGLSGPITLGVNCGSIGDYAFYNCAALTGSLDFREQGYTKIGDYAFYGCTGLTGNLYLPGKGNRIGSHAFEGCTGLTGISHHFENYSQSIGSDAFAGCTGLVNVVLETSGGIESGAFRNCTSLESVSMPSMIINNLGDGVFAGCVSLRSINVPFPCYDDFDYNQPKEKFSVPASFCNGCAALQTVHLSSGMVGIKANAFNGCSEMTTVYIPQELRIIRQGAFQGCSALTDVYFGGTQEQWNAITIEEDNNALYADKVTVHFEQSEQIPVNTLIVEETEHGTIEVDEIEYIVSFIPGAPYDFFVKPDPGYHLAKLLLVDPLGREKDIYQDTRGRNIETLEYYLIFDGPYMVLSAVFEQDVSSSASAPYQLTAANMPVVLTNGWYELTESVTLNTRLLIQGNVNLKVNAGVTLNCPEGISVYKDNTLTVSGSGAIRATGCSEDAGIGGSRFMDCGTVIIDGCTITATGDNRSAGIGGGFQSGGGTVIITGGTVYARGRGGAGLGGGYRTGGTISILGGSVTAIGDPRRGSSTEYPDAIGVGANPRENENADIQIADGLMVTVIGGETPALYDGRIEACAARGVRIEACDHSGEILLDNGGHMICRRCGLAVSGDEVGNGSAANPWRIGSEDEWNALAQSLENGLDTSGKHFRLTNDISVTAMIGSADHPFRGALNGAGHTLTFTAADAPNDCAPLRYIENAEISNLRIAGTIQTDNRWAAGLAANALGACRITNCRSSVAITSSCGGDGSHGGFVSVIAEGGSLTMNGCLFDGAITGADTTHCGGFVAYARNSVIIRNSLCAPSAYDTADSMNFARWASGCSVTIENSYYTDIAADDQGQYGYPVTAGEGVTLDFGLGTTYSVSGLTAYPAGLAYGGVFRAGTGDTVTLTAACELAAEGAVIGYAASSGTLRLTDAGYQLTLADGPSVISATFDSLFEGSGTPDDPWKIGSADDWDALASNDIDTAGKHFLLTEDIPVTTMLGVGGNRFKGCFDGNGHTLTVDLSAATAAAPFYAINGATIRNLRVTGAVSGGIHSAGLVAGANGVNLIENCAIGVRVACSGSHCGGVIGHGGASDTTLRGCVFTGSTSGATRVGTLWGWSDSGARPTIEYCLDVSDSPYPIGLGYDDPSNDLVCVYYTNAQKEAGVSRPWRQPGKQAHTITADESVTIYLGDGDTYSVSGITTCGGNAVLYYNGVYYAGQDDIMGIFIEPAQGYMRPVAVSAGTLAERAPGFCFLTMPDADVRISATPVSIFEDAGFRLPAGLAQIEAEAFDGAAMTVVDVPATCVSIGDHAFRDCESLTLIRIPAGCALGQDVFDGCDRVYVFGAAGSPADIYCQTHDNCEFVEEMQN